MATNAAHRTEPRPSLTEEAYRVLKREILENRMPPGFQALEPELAARLGMSRTPVREAVIRLKEEGLVEVVPRRGMRVLSVSPDDMREIYQILTALESEAAALLAARKPGPQVLAPLSRSVAEMADAIKAEDRERWAAADDRFHRALLDLCPNRRLSSFVSLMFDQAHRARMVTLHLRELPVRSTVEHTQLVDVIAAGDAAKVRQSYRDHRERAVTELLAILERYHLHHL
jgi:DNA-binding GntR family transcriptional regulator